MSDVDQTTNIPWWWELTPGNPNPISGRNCDEVVKWIWYLIDGNYERAVQTSSRFWCKREGEGKEPKSLTVPTTW